MPDGTTPMYFYDGDSDGVRTDLWLQFALRVAHEAQHYGADDSSHDNSDAELAEECVSRRFHPEDM